MAAEKTASYGIITPGETNGGLTEVRGLVEKPEPAEAPSRLGVIGRYILQPDVMGVLDAKERGAGGEIQLTDAMAKLIGKQPFHALKVELDAPRLRRQGGFRDRQSGDGAGAGRRRPAGPGVYQAALARTPSNSAKPVAQFADLDRPLDHARIECGLVLGELSSARRRAIRRSIRASSTSKWNGFRITSSAPAS